MSLTISAASVDALIANPSSINGYNPSAPIIIEGFISHTQASQLNAVNATYIEAKVTTTSLDNFGDITVDNSTRTSLNKFTFSSNDISATAAQLNKAQAKTSVAINASSIVGGTADITASPSSDITTLYTATSTKPVPTGIGTAKITVNDSTIDADTINLINSYSSGAVTSSAATVQGGASAVKTALTAAGVTYSAGLAAGAGLTPVKATVTDSSVDAVTLTAINAATAGLVTTTATTITGTASNVQTALDTANTEITGLSAVNVVLDDPDTAGTQKYSVAAVRGIIKATTGKVTATVSEGDVDTLKGNGSTTGLSGISATGHSLTITVTDAGISAEEINTLDAITVLPITLDPSGTDNPIDVESSAYGAALTAFQSAGVTGLAKSKVIISGNISAAEANALDALTEGEITASISDSSFSSLNNLTGTGNKYTVVVGDLTVAAADVNALVAKTKIAPDIDTVTKVTGSLTDLNTLYVTNHGKVTNTTKNEAIDVTDTSIDADLLTAIDTAPKGTSGDINLINATNVFGDATKVKAIFVASKDNSPANQISGLDLTETVTLKGSSATNANLKILAAADLKSIDEDTSGLVTIDSTVTEVTGTLTNIQYALKNATVGTGSVGVAAADISIAGIENKNIAVTGAKLSKANYLAIQNNYNTGVITAELEDMDYDTFTEKVSAGSTVKKIQSGNKLAVKITDNTLTAAKVLEIGDSTTGAVHLKPGGNMGITGKASELARIYGNIVDAKTKDGFLDTNIDATTVTVTDAVVSAADMHIIADGTDGAKTVTNVTRLVGLASDIKGFYDKSASITDDGNEALTITDAKIDASVFKLLIPDGAGPTTGDITLVGSSIEGTLSDLEAIFVGGTSLVAEHATDHSNAQVIGASSINMIATDASLAASDVKKLTNATTGIVTATIDNTVTTTESLATLIAGAGLNQAAEKIDEDFAGHNITVKLNDSEVTASGLKTLATLTAGNISLDTAATAGVQSPGLSGSISDVNSVYANSRISGLGGSAITITGGATVAQINALNTTGTITAAITDTDAATLAGLTGNTTALAITLSDTTISATQLDALDLKTTGQLNVAASTTLTGTLAEVTATLGRTATITGVGAMKVEVTGGPITVTEAVALDLLTTGKVKATIAEKDLATLGNLTDNATNGNSWVVEVDRQVADNPTTTTTDETDLVISAANLNTLNGKTDQVITVTAPTIDGTLADLNTAFGENTPIVAGKVDLSIRTISGLETKAVKITDPSITQAEAIAFQDKTSGEISATIGLNDFLTTTNTTANLVTYSGTHNTFGAIEGSGQVAIALHANAAAGTYIVTDAAKEGSGDIDSGKGSGAKFTAVVAATGGIDDFDEGEGGTAAANGKTGTLTGRVPGNYYITSANSTLNAGSTGAGYIIKVTIGNVTGSVGHVTAVAAVANGVGFTDNDTITIAKSVFGADTNNANLVLHVKGLKKGLSLTKNLDGTGYTADDTITIAAATAKEGGGGTLTKDIVFKAATVGKARPVSTATPAVYTVTTGYTSTSGGTGATFKVAVDADGYITEITGSGGEGFEVGSTVTIEDAQLGSGGATDVTFTVASVGKDSISTVINKTEGVFDLKAGNHYDIIIETNDVNAADVLAAKSLTTGLVTLNPVDGSVANITGSLADIKSIYALQKTSTGTTGIDGLSDATLNVRGDVGLISAADLKAIDAKTSGLITITPGTASITGISGTLADVKAVLKQDKHLADASNATDGVKTAGLSISGLFQSPGAIDAKGNVANADHASRTKGTYLISATGGSGIGATFEVAIDNAGASTVTLKDRGAGYADTQVLTLPKAGAYGGTANDITVAVNGTRNYKDNLTVTLTDSVTAEELKNLINSYTAIPKLGQTANASQGSIGAITATISDTTMAKLNVIPIANDTSGQTNGVAQTGITGAYTISVSDDEITASELQALDAKTTTAISLTSSAPTIKGALTTGVTATDYVNNVLASTGITSVSSVNVKSSDLDNTIEEVNKVSAATTGVVTATLTKADGTTSYTLAELAALNDTGNALTINVADTGTLDAATLNVLDGKTTGVVTVNATKISGALSDIKSLYDANTSGQVAGLGNEVVAISDTGSINAATLNGVNSLTSGVVTATAVTSVTGTLTEIKAAYAASAAGTISGLGNESISIADLGTVVTSSDLADIKALTTGTVTVSLSGTSVTAASLNSLDTNSTQTVNAAGVTTITGSAADVNTAYAASGITGLGDEQVTLTDTSLKASTLNTVDGNTSGTVTAAAATTITGSAADVNTVYAASGINGLGNEAVTLSGTSASASVLNTIDGKTTGKVDASTLTKLTGTSADVKTAFDSTGISGLTFDASNYLASYTDLLAAYGSDIASARAHYFAFGAEEGRAFDAFDETSYLASYSDLLGAFGTNVDAALVHYINNGYSEERVADAFDENSYLASNTSLIGTVTDAAAHYVNTGFAAGLALDSFDENSYLASNTSLIGTVTDATAHYVSTGYAAGLAADSFDELGYIASHSDLIAAYGADGAAGTQHFISFGSTEGRTVTFNAASYLAAHADLRAAYGTDQELAKQHYIVFGSTEGRVTA